MTDEKYFVGIDVGTSYVKSVIINSNKNVLSSFIKRTGTSLVDSSKISYEKVISKTSLSKSDIKHITATGYGKNKVSFADNTKTPQVLIGANNENQAKICSTATGKMIKASPTLYFLSQKKEAWTPHVFYLMA